MVTFLMVDFAWLFFRASDLTEAIGMLNQMATSFYMGDLLQLGLDKKDLFLLLIGIAILCLGDLCKEKGVVLQEYLQRIPIVFRYFIYATYFWAIVLLGYYGPAYDTSQFIYFQF